MSVLEISGDDLNEICHYAWRVHMAGAMLTLRMEDGKPVLGFRPKVKLDTEVADAIRKHKPAIIELMMWANPIEPTTLDESERLRNIADAACVLWCNESDEHQYRPEYLRALARWNRADAARAILVAQDLEAQMERAS